MDFKDREQSIREALHVYTVEQVIDRDRLSDFEIIWSGDGLEVHL